MFVMSQKIGLVERCCGFARDLLKILSGLINSCLGYAETYLGLIWLMQIMRNQIF